LDIAAQAEAEGVRSLRQSGLHKVKQGLTSLEEVLAVTNI
jgi:type IV pilus assembly protein PilB